MTSIDSNFTNLPSKPVQIARPDEVSQTNFVSPQNGSGTDTYGGTVQKVGDNYTSSRSNELIPFGENPSLNNGGNNNTLSILFTNSFLMPIFTIESV